MNIHTPLEVYFSNHRGMQSNPIVKKYDIKLIKASTPKSQLPIGLCVSNNTYNITFRYTWATNQHHAQYVYTQYSEIIITKQTGKMYYAGSCNNYNAHRSFMQTFETVLPIAEQVFSSGIWAKAA